MKIHEIHRRQAADEGVVSGIKTFASGMGAVAKNLGGQILDKLDPGLKNLVFKKPTTPNLSGTPAEQAAQMAEPLIKRLAKQEAEKWIKSWAAMSKHPRKLFELNILLEKTVRNTLMRGKIKEGIEKLPLMLDPDPNIQKRASDLVAQIKQDMANIMATAKATSVPTVGNVLEQWEQLVRDTYKAMSLIQFYDKYHGSLRASRIAKVKAGRKAQASAAGAGTVPPTTATPEQSYYFDGRKLNPNDPDDARMIAMIKLQDKA